MEAGSGLRCVLWSVLTGLLLVVLVSPAGAAHSRTQNFIVFAPDQQLADSVAESAERYRRELAVYWLGAPLRPWPAPCPIRVIAGPNLAAQGVTTYNPAPVRDFQMEVVGTPQRILDSVLPHEVSHTVLATHFGRPLPRWADEGICTTVEHISERSKHEAKLREFLRTRRGIAMNQLFLLREYPSDVLPMYAQGYSVCQFLIAQKGPQAFIEFLHDYMERPSWTANIKKHYQYDSLKELQDYWLAWVDAGSTDVSQFAKVQTPSAGPARGTLLAQNQSSASGAMSLHDARGNSPTGPVRQAAAVEPQQGTALAQTVSSGWYQRRRQQAQRDQPPMPAASSGQAAALLAPPSVRESGRYRSAQPQPEQQISRSHWPAPLR